MKKREGNRILLWALVLSIVAHGVIALTLRTLPKVAAHAEPTPAPITLVFRPKPTVPPTPTPPPPKTPPQPHSAPSRAPHVAAPHVSSAPAQPVGPEVAPSGPIGTPAPPGPAIAAPTGPPEPTPTPKPACAAPYVPAQAVAVVSASVPDDAAQRTGEAQIAVTLTPSGAVASAAIHRSTGDLMLDREALRAARASTYAPEIRDCARVGGTYLFTVDFTE
ncbi:MAG: TonB family protein [bacterium]|nr:TonB family protein [bacterium]